ncbi:hypothetical protein Nepgr_030954 [Nepenthes gracilis]|uniref:Uncharacterized protein n=1 Tax=Nepenthes gracilis TaxID=150966 RepID=A0AAD3TH68_NEPGR|nr:hypothetical protein Nepgr_030954 [Nepenthes gracilis]
MLHAKEILYLDRDRRNSKIFAPWPLAGRVGTLCLGLLLGELELFAPWTLAGRARARRTLNTCWKSGEELRENNWGEGEKEGEKLCLLSRNLNPFLITSSVRLLASPAPLALAGVSGAPASLPFTPYPPAKRPSPFAGSPWSICKFSSGPRFSKPSTEVDYVLALSPKDALDVYEKSGHAEATTLPADDGSRPARLKSVVVPVRTPCSWNKPKGVRQSSHRAASAVSCSNPFDVLQSDEALSTKAPSVTDDIKQQLDSSREQLSCMNLTVSSNGSIQSSETCSVSPLLEKFYLSGKLCLDDLSAAMKRGPMIASDQAEEVVEDEDDFHDPTLDALKMLLEANTTQTYLDSLTSEGRQTVSDIMEKVSLLRTPVSSNCSSRLSDRSISDAYSNHAQEGANQVTTPSELDGTWKQAKSRRHRKSTFKNSKGSLGKYVAVDFLMRSMQWVELLFDRGTLWWGGSFVRVTAVDLVGCICRDIYYVLRCLLAGMQTAEEL